MFGETYEIQRYVAHRGDWYTLATAEIKLYAEITMQALEEHYNHAFKFRIVGGRH